MYHHADPQFLRVCSYLEMGIFTHQAKMRSLRHTRIQHDCVLVRGGNVDTETHVDNGRRCAETQGEDHHPSAKERGLEQTLTSQPSEGPNRVSTLILDL